MMGTGRLDTIKIKATVATEEVSTALAAYHLSRSTAHSYEIYFCEQPSRLGLLPLLDNAVVLRVRRHLKGPGDVTVKLRPCRPGQLRGEWSSFRRSAHHQLRIKGDWAHDRRTVAASLIYSMPDGHIRQVLEARPPDPRRLISARQRKYLAECTVIDPGLEDLYLLGPVEARRWRLSEPRYEITAERWTVRIPHNPSGLDFLELSVTAEPDDAALVQPAFLASIRHRGLDPYAFQQTKTRHVLRDLGAYRPI